MTDLEMTKLCAEAMGLWEEVKIGDKKYEHPPLNYDPLHDDAQAMALVKKFDVSITSLSARAADHWFVQTTGTKIQPSIIGTAYDLNRAIVECVAKMQAAKVV